MYRCLLATTLFSALLFVTGCSPAEVQPPKESIPDIPAGRASAPASTPGAAGGAAPSSRTPGAPK